MSSSYYLTTLFDNLHSSVTTTQLQRDQTLPLSGKGVACGTKEPNTENLVSCPDLTQLTRGEGVYMVSQVQIFGLAPDAWSSQSDRRVVFRAVFIGTMRK